MQKINTVTWFSPNILAICYFGKLWVCLDMHSYSQQKLQNESVSSISICLDAKSQTITQLFPETLVIPYSAALWACPRMHDNIQINYIINFRFHGCQHPCKKSKQSLNSFLRYYNVKNPAIWLDESILGYNSRTRILQDICFALENKQWFHLSFWNIFRET